MVATPSPSSGDPSSSHSPDSRALLVRRIKSALLTALGLLAPLLVLFAAHIWGNRPALDFVSGTITGPDQRTRPITLPYSTDREPQSAKYRYELEFNARAAPRSTLQLIPDDCLRSLSVNGTPFPLTSISAQKLCDFHTGVDIDIGRALHAGRNHVTAEVENVSGPHGLTVYWLREANPVNARSILLLILLVPACFAALRSLRLGTIQRLVAAVLIALAGWLRYHFVFDWHAPESFVFSDMAGYVDRAQQMVQGRGDENQAFQPLGYSMALALSLRLVGDFALAVWGHALLGWATVVLVWRASARWLRSPWNLVVLAIAALHVPFITLSGFFLAETFFTFQLALLLYCLARFAFPWRIGPAFVLGLVYMSALWMKGNNTLFGPLVMAWLAYWVFSHPRVEWASLVRRLLPSAIAFCVGAAIVVASHATFTKMRYGHAHLSASTSSLNLVEGKCPSKRNNDSAGYGWQSPLFVQLGENEEKHWPRPFTDEKFFWAAGVDCIKRDPAVLLTSVRYVYYLFFDNQLWPPNTSRFAPLVRAYGMFYSAILFPGILLGAIVIARRRRQQLAFVLLIGVSICACSWVFKSELRYRVPFDTVFIPIGVIGWSWVVGRLRRGKRVERVELPESDR